MGVAKLKITHEMLADILYFPEEAVIIDLRREDPYRGCFEILLTDPSLPEGVMHDAHLTITSVADETESQAIIRRKGHMTFTS